MTKPSAQGGKPNFVDTTIVDFKNSIKDLARPNLFQVEMKWPPILGGTTSGQPQIGGLSGSQANKKETDAGSNNLDPAGAQLSASYLIKAANIPASTVGVIEVPYRGRVLKIAGDRTYEPWTITVLNDHEFSIRSKFEEWSSKIQALQQNRQQAANISQYCGNAEVVQIGRDSQPVKIYSMKDIWPSNISAIDLAWDSNDTPEEYTVELQVQYWTWGVSENTAFSKDLAELTDATN